MDNPASSYFLKGLENVNGRWDLIEIIGEGTYGEVYKGVGKKGELVAVKVIENTPNKHDECQMESLILQRFGNHKNIVDYYGTFIYTKPSKSITTSQIWIVIEYCEGGSVSELAKMINEGGNTLSEKVIKYIIHQTLTAIHFLHSNRIIHRDIKGPNILMTSKGDVKLIDCGVSAVIPHTLARRHSSVGSPFWMAPEVIACEQQLDYTYDNRCDIWSLGVTSIELADGEPPMAELHPMSALFKIPRNPPPTVRNPKIWSETYLKFIARAVTKDFELRPDAVSLLQDPFLLECQSQDELLNYRRELMSLLHVTTKQFKSPGVGTDVKTLQQRMENARKNRQYLEVDDLTALPNLTNEIILKYIMERFVADQIYTYIGDILIAVNPFKEIPIYGKGASLLYCYAQKESLPPHIFMVACSTYQSLLHKQIDQCCVISGESGSGKTVSANFLVHQLAWIGKSSTTNISINQNLVKKILQVNPLMEAFGNAQTIINTNSSRFGKFLELHFTQSGALVGAQLSEYLLEKSRVVSQPRGERNFHVLYYMIAGLDFHKKLEQFELNTSNKHRYLNTDELSLAECACTSEMQVKFTQVQQCFEVLGFTKEEIQSLYCILAAVIHLGDIEFMVDDLFSYEGEKAKIVNFQTLETVTSLLCVEKRDLSEGMVTNSSVTRGETITRNNTVEQALDCRDATAKALYGRLVTWIVKRINALLRAEDKTNTLHTRIGILDIFGFENFSQNSFEQLCINIANEQLQFYFNEHVFVWEFEEYSAEGLKGFNIEFKNNKPVLDLFLQKPVGILALLDEESRFPKASDLTLVEKFQDNIDSQYMIASKETNTFFTIKHFAEKVTYDATGFLEKNRDTLSMEVVQTLRQSRDKTLAALFLESDSKLDTRLSGTSSHSSQSAATNRFQQTVSVHFRQSLRSLLSKVIKAEPHFVRCLRPNLQNNPYVFDENKVMKQLRYTGVLETTEIRRKGFSERVTFKNFIQRYKFIAAEESQRMVPSSANCEKILRKSKIDEDESWKIGKTKVFLKYWHAEKLSSIAEIYRAKIAICQRVVRQYLLRKYRRNLIEKRHNAATKIRAAWLGYKDRQMFKNMDKKKDDMDAENSEMSKLHSRKKPVLRPTSNLELMESRRSSVISGHSRVPHLNTPHKDNLRVVIETPRHPVSVHTIEEWNENLQGSKWEKLRAYIQHKALSKSDGLTALRPYYRNMKREKRGYEDYEDFYSSDEGDNASNKMDPLNIFQNNVDLESSNYERINDPDGQAALEETRAIILLSQIDLASKEALEMLQRTSYPVIHSVRATANREGVAPKLKNQKLDHKDRTIAVVDGFGDPLRQKYRLAKLHYAEDGNAIEKPEHKNEPMLGLAEKPKKREETQEEGKPVKTKRKPAAKATRKQLPPSKATVKDDFYPSRSQQRTTPKTKTDWFYPAVGAKVNKEKKAIEDRMLSKPGQQETRVIKRSKAPPAINNNNNNNKSYREQVLESRRDYYPRNDHKPFNYLMNDRTDQRNVFGHEYESKKPQYTPRASYNPPHHFPAYIISSPSQKNARKPVDTIYYDPKPRNPRDNVLRNNFLDAPRATDKPRRKNNPDLPPPRKGFINSVPPVLPARQTVYSDYENNPINRNTRDLKPRALPGLTSRPLDFSQSNSKYMKPSDDIILEKPKTRRPNGFNYGLKQEHILQDLKLKKTGRLQGLLDRRT